MIRAFELSPIAMESTRMMSTPSTDAPKRSNLKTDRSVGLETTGRQATSCSMAEDMCWLCDLRGYAKSHKVMAVLSYGWSTEQALTRLINTIHALFNSVYTMALTTTIAQKRAAKTDGSIEPLTANRLRTVSQVLLVAISGAWVSSCALDPPPSESHAQQLFDQAINSKRGDDGHSVLGNFRLTSFKKADGLASNVDGINKYRLDYTAMLEYPEGNNSYCIDNSMPPRGKSHFSCLLPSYNVQAVGAIQKLHGSMSFVKTEKGWTPETMTVRCERGHMSHGWCSQ